MKDLFKFALLPAVAFTAFLNAEEEKEEVKGYDVPTYSTLTIKPEIVYGKDKSKFADVKVSQKKKGIGIKLEQEKVALSEYYYASDLQVYATRVKSKVKAPSNVYYTTTGKPIYARIEGRLGKAFAIPLHRSIYAIPFGGLGYHHIHFGHASRIGHADSFYLLTGGKVVYKHSESLSMGFQGKVLFTPMARYVEDGHRFSCHPNCFGYEISTPITWRPLECTKWGLNFEPRVVTFDASKGAYQLGFKINLAYAY